MTHTLGIVNRREAAELLGVSTRTIRRWEDSGLIEPVRIGGIVRIRIADLQKLIEPK